MRIDKVHHVLINHEHKSVIRYVRIAPYECCKLCIPFDSVERETDENKEKEKQFQKSSMISEPAFEPEEEFTDKNYKRESEGDFLFQIERLENRSDTFLLLSQWFASLN